VIPYGKWRPVALKWGSHEELYRPLPLPFFETANVTVSLRSNTRVNARKTDSCFTAVWQRRQLFVPWQWEATPTGHLRHFPHNKATDFKFGRYIQTVHPNKSPLKILGKVAIGVLRDSRNFQGTHIYGTSRGQLSDSVASCLQYSLMLALRKQASTSERRGHSTRIEHAPSTNR